MAESKCLMFSFNDIATYQPGNNNGQYSYAPKLLFMRPSDYCETAGVVPAQDYYIYGDNILKLRDFLNEVTGMTGQGRA